MFMLSLLAAQGCASLLVGQEDEMSVQAFGDMVKSAPYINPANETVLSQGEIEGAIIGNTLIGPIPESVTESIEYFDPDGTVLGVWRDRRTQGMWSISGPLLCVYYPRQRYTAPRAESQIHCFTLTVDNDSVQLFSQSGRPLDESMSLLAGNPRRLSAAED
jgi:hypothetical protein